MGMTNMEKVAVERNKFQGALPTDGLKDMTAMERFIVSWNSFEGALPAEGLRGMMWVEWFFIRDNLFQGMLPTYGFEGMELLQSLNANNNKLQGSLPEEGLKGIGSVMYLNFATNLLQGSLPAEGLRGITHAEVLGIRTNRLQGMLPSEGLKGLTALQCLDASENQFDGELPVEGLKGMSGMLGCYFAWNQFQGNLHVTDFFSALKMLLLDANRFSGTVPQSLATPLETLLLGDNLFQGALPPSKNVAAYLAEHNSLEGSIPSGLAKSVIVLAGLRHKGTVPSSLSRMSMLNTSVVLGHGLSGSLPKVQATCASLSLWANSLTGHLSDMHLLSYSGVLFHRNQFSCRLPLNYGTGPALSMALVGNSFTQPRAFPPWIHSEERGTMFCVAEHHGKKLLFKLIPCPIFLCLTVYLSSMVARKSQGKQALDGFHDAARRAWCVTSRLLLLCSIASCLLYYLYIVDGVLTCAVLLQRMQFPFIAEGRTLETLFEMAIFLSFSHTSERFHRTHAFASTPARRQLVTAKGPGETSDGSLVNAMVWNFWLLLSVLASAPATVYAAVKAVPGFLRVQKSWQWLADGCILLLAASTSMGLPFIAKSLCGASDSVTNEVTLLAVGQLFATPIVPCVVTITFHSDCLGAWVFLWEACSISSSVTGAWRESTIHAGVPPTVYKRKLISRGDVCGLNHYDASKHKCARAVFQRLLEILMTKLVQLTFTLPACRLVSGRRMPSQAACVQLAYAWQITLMLGACLPILFPLSTLLAAVHGELLFGSFQLMERRDGDEQACVTRSGWSLAFAAAVLLQITMGVP